ncbi:MAG TPA: hypothetical protein VNZ61_08925 [Roseomonas sp.]|nr:hypothetical protein [Roseomonas sp.]
MNHGYLPIRKDLSIRVAADFYFVEKGEVSIFWLQPRRAFALDNKQLGMFGALLRRTLLTGDFEAASLEILDLSAPDRKQRVPRTLGLCDLPEVTEEEAAEAVQRVVQAYEAIQKMDINWDERRAPRKERPSPQADIPGL